MPPSNPPPGTLATVLVSDRALDLPEDVGAWADAVLWRACPGYDFTSWKGALEFFPSLAEAQELLLTNDSIFAPTNPLQPVHALMDTVDCDFWGLSEGGVYRLALQSSCLVFRRACLVHPAFWSFWTTVDTTTDKRRHRPLRTHADQLADAQRTPGRSLYARKGFSGSRRH